MDKAVQSWYTRIDTSILTKLTIFSSIKFSGPFVLIWLCCQVITRSTLSSFIIFSFIDFGIIGFSPPRNIYCMVTVYYCHNMIGFTFLFYEDDIKDVLSILILLLCTLESACHHRHCSYICFIQTILFTLETKLIQNLWRFFVYRDNKQSPALVSTSHSLETQKQPILSIWIFIFLEFVVFLYPLI